MAENLTEDELMQFMECAECTAKPGTPTLCKSCLHNRNALAILRRRTALLKKLIVIFNKLSREDIGVIHQCTFIPDFNFDPYENQSC